MATAAPQADAGAALQQGHAASSDSQGDPHAMPTRQHPQVYRCWYPSAERARRRLHQTSELEQD